MGLGNGKVSRRSVAWRYFAHTFSLGSLLILALMFLPSTAAAQSTPISACGSISSSGSYTVSTQITGPGTGTCLTITASNVTLDMTGGSINMIGADGTAVAISVAAGATGVTIENGFIYMDYPNTTGTVNGPAAIEASGTSGLDVNAVTILNGPTTTPCTPSTQDQTQNYGTGIFLSNVTGASIVGNTAYCFQYGIYVQGSAVPSNGTGLIQGNDAEGDAWEMTSGSADVLSGGIILDGSTGWTVSGNTVNYDGSHDNSTAETCNNTGTGELITCQFALQVINSSSGNTISGNFLYHTAIGGIYAGPVSSGNTFTGNFLNDNGEYSLFDSTPHKLKNTWSGNSCGTSPTGGTVPHRACS